MLPSDSHADISVEARRHFELASSLDEQENFGAALVECDQALRLAPRWAEAHNFRGLLLEELGRTHDAISAYRGIITRSLPMRSVPCR
jgi:Flp pilus assembly protein TadD